MRIATWNVNSLRSRSEQVLRWLVERKIDVALIQETKCIDQAFPFDQLQELGYEAVHHGVNHWNGVAIISRIGIDHVVRGFDTNEEFDEPRLIAATCGGVRCWSVYVPNGRSIDDPHFGYKLKWNYVGTQFAKNKGLRIDLALASPSVAAQVEDIWVDRPARDPLVLHPAKSSDHAPLIIDLT